MLEGPVVGAHFGPQRSHHSNSWPPDGPAAESTSLNGTRHPSSHISRGSVAVGHRPQYYHDAESEYHAGYPTDSVSPSSLRCATERKVLFIFGPVTVVSGPGSIQGPHGEQSRVTVGDRAASESGQHDPRMESD